MVLNQKFVFRDKNDPAEEESPEKRKEEGFISKKKVLSKRGKSRSRKTKQRMIISESKALSPEPENPEPSKPNLIHNSQLTEHIIKV